MDLSSMWLPELISQEIEDGGGFMSYNDKMIKSYDTVVDNLSADSFSSDSYTENARTSFQTHPSNEKASYNINKSSSLVAPTHSSSAFTISFGDHVKPEVESSQLNDLLIGYEAVNNAKVHRPMARVRVPVQTQDHVLAERKRRQKLNQHFISMSALLPNLKKLDKASVLEDAANYIRELQDRVKELEGGLSGKDAKESVVIALKSSRLSDDDDELSPNETESADCSADVSSKPSTEIEVRMSENSVLIRIHSQKNSSLLTKVLSRIDKIGLSVISSSAIPFANTDTLIMIVAQVEVAFFMTATDLVRNLQQAL